MRPTNELSEVPSSEMRQKMAHVLNQSRQEPIELFKGGINKGKAIAVLIGHSKFAAMRHQADQVETPLRELSTHEFTGSAKAQLAAFRQRLRATIADIRTKSQYTSGSSVSGCSACRQ